MRNVIARAKTVQNECIFPAMWAVSISFLVGDVIGFFLAIRITQGDEKLARYFEQLIGTAGVNSLRIPSVAVAGWNPVLWLLAVVVVSCTAVRLPGVVAIIVLRGFFFSFSVASFARACSGLGLEVAFLLFGLPAFLSLPAFLLMSAVCLSSGKICSCRCWPGIEWDRNCVLRIGLCVIACVLSAVVEVSICPHLLISIAEGYLLN